VDPKDALRAVWFRARSVELATHSRVVTQPIATKDIAMSYAKSIIPVFVVAAIGLAGCQKAPEDKQADAVRNTTEQRADAIEQHADVVEKTGETAAASTEQNAGANADAMRQEADAVRDQGEKTADAIEDKK
jgi:hypothetical protein